MIFKLIYSIILIATVSIAHASPKGSISDIVGFDSEVINPTGKMPIAGYAGMTRRKFPWPRLFRKTKNKWFKYGTGIHQDIRVKVMSLKTKENKHILFFSYDFVGIMGNLKSTLEKKLTENGITFDEIVVTATHTHNGPGGLTKKKLWQIFAMDRFVRSYFNFVIDKSVLATQNAIKNAKQAKIYHVQVPLPLHSRNRSNFTTKTDPNANLIYAKDLHDNYLGAIFNYAVHPTVLGQKNYKFSSDWAGSVETKLEETLEDLSRDDIESTVMFINSAEGDISHTVKKRDLKTTAIQISNKVKSYLAKAKIVDTKFKSYKTVKRLVQKPRLNFKQCKIKFFRFRGISLRRMFRRTFESKVLTLGNLMIFLWPGEPSYSLGMEATKLVPEGMTGINFGLANNYVAYLVTPREWDNGPSGINCNTFFGRNGGMGFINGFKEALTN